MPREPPDTERPSFDQSPHLGNPKRPGLVLVATSRGPPSQPAQPLGNPKTGRLGPGRYGFLGMGGRLCGGSVGDQKIRSHLVSSSRKLTHAYLRLSQAQMAAGMDMDCEIDEFAEAPPPPPECLVPRPGKRDSTATSAADEVRRFTYTILRTG